MTKENSNMIEQKYYIENIDFTKKKVVCRLDFNIVMENGNIVDDFRVVSALPTINYIIQQNPAYLVLSAHFGRPVANGYHGLHNEKFSMKFIVPLLEKYLQMKVVFLPNGISDLTLHRLEHEAEIKKIKNDNTVTVYMLENLRFSKEETAYDNIKENDTVVNTYKNFADIFISDAFGCAHRKHMSVYGIKDFGKTIGYGYLMKKEMNALNMLVGGNDKKILCIMGGNKVSDKMPLINCLKLIPNSTVFIAGGIATKYDEVHSNVIVMKDGYGNVSLENKNTPEYIPDISTIGNEESNSYGYCAYDIGFRSLQQLLDLANESDVIFWNGSLGVIEHDIYRKGSIQLMNHLISLTDKTIIIGGGETASLATEQHDHIYVSTGGGALLEYVRDRVLYNKYIPGLDIFT